MEASAKIIMGLLLIAFVVFAAVILGATVGALVGWVVGLVFDESMALLAKALGIPNAQPYQIGVILGFVAGFFRATSSSKE